MKKIIGFFLDSGDNLRNNEIFTEYKKVYDYSFLEKYLADKQYGHDLNLILIQYHVSGKFRDWSQIRSHILNYSQKQKAISVIVGVKIEDFIALPHQQKKQFLVDTTRQAVLDVRARLEKKKLDIDFDQLLKDLDEVNKKYLESE